MAQLPARPVWPKPAGHTPGPPSPRALSPPLQVCGLAPPGAGPPGPSAPGSRPAHGGQCAPQGNKTSEVRAGSELEKRSDLPGDKQVTGLFSLEGISRVPSPTSSQGRRWLSLGQALLGPVRTPGPPSCFLSCPRSCLLIGHGTHPEAETGRDVRARTTFCGWGWPAPGQRRPRPMAVRPESELCWHGPWPRRAGRRRGRGAVSPTGRSRAPCCWLPSSPAALPRSRRPRGGCTASRAVRHLAPARRWALAGAPPEGTQCLGERPHGAGREPAAGIGRWARRKPWGSHTSGAPRGHRRGPQARSTARRRPPSTLSSHDTGPAGAGGSKEGTGARSALPEHGREREAEPAPSPRRGLQKEFTRRVLSCAGTLPHARD